MIFDCIAIGKGLIGCAAARYLSETLKNVAVIGPDEHADIKKAIVFSTHYHHPRVQRIVAKHPVCVLLNLQSSPQYNFFESGRAIHNVFPDFEFPQLSKGIFEDSPSGYINPRLLIKAQLSLFQKNDGIVINEIANEINYEKNYWQIETTNKKIYKAKKVLLCPGAFINFFNLTKNKLALTLKSETTLWAKVSKQEASRLSKLPSLLYEIDNPVYKNVYLIQPVQYPDGKYYLKIGCNLGGDIYFDSIQDIRSWFRNGTSDANLNILKGALLKIMPGIKAEEYFTKRCIISFTEHRKPYIGLLNNNGLFVACGGNGYSAMCSDALGRIASHLLIKGIFPNEYSAESFEPVFTGSTLKKVTSY